MGMLVRCPSCAVHIRVDEPACPFCGAERCETPDRSGVKLVLTAAAVASVLAISCGGYGGACPCTWPPDAPIDAPHTRIDAPVRDAHGPDAPEDAGSAAGSDAALPSDAAPRDAH